MKSRSRPLVAACLLVAAAGAAPQPRASHVLLQVRGMRPRAAWAGPAAHRLRGGGGDGSSTPMECEEEPTGLGRTIALMEQEMKQAAADMKFEDAARLRDAIEVLRRGATTSAVPCDGTAAESEEALTFDWERARGVAPIQVPRRPARREESSGRRAASPRDLSRWPTSDAAFAEMETDDKADKADRATIDMLNEARNAMHRADAGDKPNLSQVIKAFDAALERLVEQGVKDNAAHLVACLRLLQQELSSISKGESRRLNLSAGDFTRLSPQLLQAAGETLETIGFVPHVSQGVLELADDYPLYVLREAEGSLELKLGHLDPPRDSTPPAPSIRMSFEERGVVLLVPPAGPVKVPEVPDDVYNFTARDLMDVLESNKKYYEDASLLMTSGMRQRRNDHSRPSNHSTCRVRVRLADGAMLEAAFDVSEGVNALLAVLDRVFAEASPEVVLTTPPPVQVLTQENAAARPWHTMASLGLVPAGVLNCRGLGGKRLDSTCLRQGIPTRELSATG